MGLSDHGLGGVPVDATIGDGNAIFEICHRLGECLTAVVEIALHHRADDTGVDEALAYDLSENFRLAAGVLAAVGVAAIRHDGGDEACCCQLVAGHCNLVGAEVRAMRAAAQYDVAIRITLGGQCAGLALIVDAEESLWLAGRFDCVDRDVEVAVGAVFEAERHGQAGGHLAVGLALGGSCADGGPADEVGDVLRSDRVQ